MAAPFACSFFRAIKRWSQFKREICSFRGLFCALYGLGVSEMTSKFGARRLEGKVAVLTAATLGMGYATAERLGHEGAKLVISSRDQKNVDAAVQRLIDSELSNEDRTLSLGGLHPENVCGTAAHVAKPADLKNLIAFAVQKYGCIDILFNNAGINPSVALIKDTDMGKYDRIFEVNVKAAFMLCRFAVPHMRKGGSIVLNGSICAYKQHEANAAYSLSKLALTSLTQALSAELAPKGIRVNCVCPGLVKTEMSRLMWDKDHPKQQVNYVREGVDMLGYRKIASVVAYLASDDSSFVSGETHLATGGVDCRL